MSRPPLAIRRYTIRIGVTMSAYTVSLIAANLLIEGERVTGLLAWFVALMPGLSIAGMFLAVGMLMVEQKDEFLRMLLVRQNLIATTFAMSTVVTWGFLERFDLVGHVPGYYIVLLWVAGLVIGAASNRITHGTWGWCR